MTEVMTNLVRIAIEQFGSEAKLAAAAGVTQVAINKAKQRADAGHLVSATLAVALERATDGKVSREQLRPDLWSKSGVAA